MKKLALLMCMLSMAGFASAATIRYMQSGPWETLAMPNGSGGWIGPGWQSAVPPGAGDTVRANWGGNTITLNYETTVGAFQAGVDESGTFHILSGGILNAGNSKIGNNNFCTGTMIIDAGGRVNATGGWLMIAGNTNVTGVAEVSGMMNTASHLWMATGLGSTATLNIYNGGVVNVGGMIGLGTIDAVNPSGGMAAINIMDGGLLALANIHGSGTSVQAGSMIYLNDSGRITLPGDFTGVMNNLYIPTYITGNGILGNAQAVFADGITTVTAIPEPATLSLLGLGALALLRKRK